MHDPALVAPQVALNNDVPQPPQDWVKSEELQVLPLRQAEYPLHPYVELYGEHPYVDA